MPYTQEELDRWSQPAIPDTEVPEANKAPYTQEDLDRWSQPSPPTGLDTSLSQAAFTTPDEAIKRTKLAGELGVDPSLISNLQDAEREAFSKRINPQAITTASPGLAKSLEDPHTASIARDSLDVLIGVANKFKNLGGSLAASAFQAGAGVYGGLQLAADVLPLPKSVSTELAKIRRGQEAQAAYFRPEAEGIIEKGVYGGIESAGQTVGLLGAAVVSKNPSLLLYGLPAISAGGAYGEAKDTGVSTLSAASYAARNFAIEYWTEKLPGLALLKGATGKTGLYSMAKDFLAKEVPGEQIATHLQDLDRWITLHPENTFEDYWNSRPAAAAETFVATIVGGGAQIGAAKGIEYTARRMDAKAQAVSNRKTIGELSESFTNEPLRTKAPEKFKEIIASMAEDDGSVKELWVDANTLTEALHASKIDIADLQSKAPEIFNQLSEASQSGTDVRVPIEDYATYIAGTELDAQLLDHLKVSPHGETYAQAKLAEEQQGAELKAEAEKLAEPVVLTREEFEAKQAEEEDLAKAVAQANIEEVKALTRRQDTDMRLRVARQLAKQTLRDRKEHVEKLLEGIPPGSEQEKAIMAYERAGQITFGREDVQKAIEEIKNQPAMLPGEVQELRSEIDRLAATLTPEQRVVEETGLPPTATEADRRKDIERRQFVAEQIAKQTEAAGGVPPTREEIQKEIARYEEVRAAGAPKKQTYEDYLAEHADKKAAWELDVANVHAKIKDQLKATGRFTSGVSEANTIPVRDFYVTMAKRMGTTPSKLFERYPLTIRDESTGPAFDQSNQDLRGLPVSFEVNGELVDFHASAKIREVARNYMEKAGLSYMPVTNYVKVDKDRAARIAAEFDKMKHDPTNPDVRAAYEALAKEALAQWEAIKETGLVVEFITGEDPYPNPRMAIKDITDNNHLWVYPTTSGFGGEAAKAVDVTGNPLLGVVPGETISGRPVQLNDIFRIVHDYFGHAKEGVGFRAEGEENAWRIHSSMFSPLARKALTTETRGQNSWLNFGPYGEKNRAAVSAETQYAPQKTGILPDWVVNDGVRDGVSVVGSHFSHAQRDSLTGDKYGTGITGAEAKRLKYAEDSRLRSRIAFYVDEGNGIKPEAGLGIFRHDVQLTGLYDAVTDPMRLNQADKNAFESAIIDNGFSGYYARNAFGNQGAVVLLGDAAKKVEVKANDSYAQSEVDELGFYSPLMRGVYNAKQPKAKGKEWASIVKSLPGVKKEELYFTGLEEWLALHMDETITKDKVLLYLSKNGIQLEEVVAGELTKEDMAEIQNETNARFDQEVNNRVEYAMDRFIGTHGYVAEMEDDTWGVYVDDSLIDTYETEREAENDLADIETQERDDYENNIRNDIERNIDRDEIEQEVTEELFGGQTAKYEDYTLPYGENYKEVLLTLPNVSGVDYALRSLQRKMDDIRQGRLPEDLSMEERARFDSILAEYKSLRKKRSADYESSHFEDIANIVVHVRIKDREAVMPDGSKEKVLFLEEIQSDWGQQKREGLRVPEGPFISDTKTWTALAIKRMIRYASENGYDRIAWTTGEQQIARYNLRRHISKISAIKRSEGGYYIRAETATGRPVLSDSYKEEDLPGVVGAEIAAKIVAGQTEFEGEDLEVGGEGMIKYYDNIVPSVFTDVLKKIGMRGDLFGGGFVERTNIAMARKDKYSAESFLRPDSSLEYKVTFINTRTPATANVYAVWSEAVAAAEAMNAELSNTIEQPSIAVTPELRALAMEGLPLFQGRRGSFNPSTMTISLLKNADLSTFIHESGHFYLDALAAMASRGTAPKEVVEDFNKVLKWFAIKDVETWQAMSLEEKRPYHEQWAESYELFTLEGKAPTRELQPVFSRFRSWLLSVYKSVENFLATHPAAGKLNDEIRGVFSRMIASEEAIKETEQLNGYEALFTSAADAGISEEEYKKYVAAGESATEAAITDMQARSLKDMKWLSNAKTKAIRALQQEARAKRAVIEEQVRAEVMEEPINKARAEMKKEDGIKLHTGLLKEQIPGIDVKKLHGMTHAEDGTNPEQVADIFGFNSSKDLIDALLYGEDPEAKISAITDQRMLEQHGELIDQRAIETAANKAVHNEGRARFLATGLKLLSKSPVPVSKLNKAANDAALLTVRKKKIRDLHPKKYEAAEAKASKLALTQVAKDPAKAVQAQRAALLNNRLARTSSDALDVVDAGVARMLRLQKAVAQSNMRGEFLDQLNALMDRFDIRKSRTLKEIDTERTPLGEWLASESDRISAVMPDIPAWVVNESTRRHYKDLTVEEFNGLIDTIKALEVLARREEEQYQAIRGMKFAEERKAILDRIRVLHPEAFNSDNDPKGLLPDFIPKTVDIKKMGENFAGEFLNAETIISMLEGGEFGQVNESLFGRLNAGVDSKVTRMEKIYAMLKPSFDAYSLKERIDFSRKAVGTIAGNSITRENAVVIALLHGSNDGRERLANYGWSEAEQLRALQILDGRDLDLVENIWTVFDDHLWPELKALNERTRGKAPAKVAAAGYRVHGRDMKGGYFRLKYDTNLDERAYRLDEGAAVKELLGGGMGMGAKTAQGTSTERKTGVTMRPRLDLGVFSETVNETVHDLALREAVADTMRLLNDNGIQNVIKTTAGVPSYRALVTRVREIAAPPRNPSGFIEKTLSIARRNTVTTLMSGLGTALQNVTGVSSSYDRVPAGVLSRELAIFFSPKMASRVEFCLSQSEYMKHRYNSFDRDLQDMASKLTVNGRVMPETATMLWFLGQTDKAVSIPTWNAAFVTGMKEFQNDQKKAVAYADHIVRQTQGSGRELDLSAIMSGHGGYGQLKKVFTMFYSYFNAQLGSLVRAGAVSKTLAKENPALATALFTKNFLLVFVLPAVLAKMVFSGNAPEDDDWMHKYGTALLQYGLGMIPLVRDIGNYLLVSFDKELPNYGLKMTPVQSAAEGVVKGSVALRDIATGEGTDKDTKDAIMGVSYAVGLPGKLIANTTMGTKAVLEGEAEPKALIYGPPPEYFKE